MRYTFVLIMALGVPAIAMASAAGCGGSTPNAEAPAAEKSAEPAASLAAPETSAAPAASIAETAAAPTETTPPPPAPKFSEGDCGKCAMDKGCARQLKACEANAECKDVADAINACPAAKDDMKACMDKVAPPKSVAAKHLATAYSSCIAKLDKDKHCKDKCK